MVTRCVTVCLFNFYLLPFHFNLFVDALLHRRYIIREQYSKYSQCVSVSQSGSLWDHVTPYLAMSYEYHYSYNVFIVLMLPVVFRNTTVQIISLIDVHDYN